MHNLTSIDLQIAEQKVWAINIDIVESDIQGAIDDNERVTVCIVNFFARSNGLQYRQTDVMNFQIFKRKLLSKIFSENPEIQSTSEYLELKFPGVVKMRLQRMPNNIVI